MTFDFVTTEKFTAFPSFALLNPPSLTRLEPQTATGDPRPGLEARVHDPLWLIGRQWQLGEFAGEDAGTPLTVRVVTQSAKVDRWATNDGVRVQAIDHEHQDLLETLIEREPVLVGGRGPGLRQRAEAASALLSALDDAALGKHRAAFAANCPLDVDQPLNYPDGEHAGLDPDWVRLTRLLRGRGMADSEQIAAAWEAASPGLPLWLTPADDAERALLVGVIEPWLTWYRDEVSPLPGGEDAWVGERLEYQFQVGVGAQVFAAPAYGGADLDWHTFDVADTPLAGPGGGPVLGAAQREIHALLASPLRYAGMPADRLWEMEDAQVNFGLVESEPWDLARLLVAEFALTFGNDWLVVPVDVAFGSLTTVESVLYTTTFGERFVVEPTGKVSPDGHWRMFTNTRSDGTTPVGLLIPPGAVAVSDGPAIEDVLFLRDEMANLCWAVERAVQGPGGAARDRARERDDPGPTGPGPVASAQLDYLLQTSVPARWIPYLPRTSGYRAVELVQGAMPDPDGNPVRAIGRLLRTGGVGVLKDAEIPREGVNIRRQPAITRRADGRYLRWTTRRVTIGRGEGTSRLAFDSAVPRRPQPTA